MDDPKRIYFQLPEERADCKRLKMVCLQLPDGSEMWFESQKSIQWVGRKFIDALKQKESLQARLDAVETVLTEKYFAAEDDCQIEVVLVDDVKAALKGD